uniref:Uncharacterized protein n=1 Tax=Fusarium oxysporum (strain Fo5176) TaxID=660025 RepID=A0A0D2XKV6_FUSOF
MAVGELVPTFPRQTNPTSGTLFSSVHDCAEVCNTITQSFAPAKINSQHIANVYELGRQAGDCSTIFPGWDLFNHRDVTITSWADLDLYQMNWGSELGQPDFVRFPFSVADGVCIILPRRRVNSAPHSQNLVEVVIMLKAEHLDALKTDSLWQSLTLKTVFRSRGIVLSIDQS